jgi:hypothetical protein
MADSKNMSDYGRKKSFDDEDSQDPRLLELKEAIKQQKIRELQDSNDELQDDTLTENVTNSYNENNDIDEQDIKKQALQRMRNQLIQNQQRMVRGLYGEQNE